MRPTPFTIQIPQDKIADLRDRLARTRFPNDFGNDDWRYGFNTSYLKELVTYWAGAYDWRAQEARMNAFNHYKVEIDDIPIHFIHERGKGRNPIPLILSHGWPWTFWDMRHLIGPLTDPAAYGGNSDDSFDVIVPSLPGFGFSGPLKKTGVNPWRTADLWVRLMRDVCGYERFAAHGGDFGALVSAQLGHRHAKTLIGLHLTVMIPLGFWNQSEGPSLEDYAPEEKAWHDRTQHFLKAEMAYATIQATKPQTIASALHDSPAGLAAWLIEKRRAWSDCSGDVEARFPKEDLCTTASIYWHTECFGTSARYYYEALHDYWTPDHPGPKMVAAPTAVAVFPNDVFLMPKAWAQKYYNLKRWTVFDKGGHFAAAEEPESVIADIRTFFRDYR